MILALAAALAIVVQDHAPLRSGAQAGATELALLSQGDVLEIRGEQAGYLQVYNYRRERGGYLRADIVRPLELTPEAAPALLSVLRFLRDSRGAEALGISYGAAYLKAVPAPALTAEPFNAIALMAERLADLASGNNAGLDVATHLDVVAQSGVRMRSFERNGRMQVCYDGELFHRVLAMRKASAEERALAALGLTRPDCIDPTLAPAARASLDRDRAALLEGIAEQDLTALTRSRLHARRAAVWAAIAFAQARRGESPAGAGQRALAELLDVRASDLGEDRRSEYAETLVRVSASRWAAALPGKQTGALTLSTAPNEAGQTCVTLRNAAGATASLVQRCTYGIAWIASAQLLGPGEGAVLAVQPLEGWRELWVFHRRAGIWVADVLPPGFDEPDAGYVDFAGYASPSHRLLIAREVRDHGRWHRSFEELRLNDLVTIRQASRPDLLRDFGTWQDAAWRRESLSLH